MDSDKIWAIVVGVVITVAILCNAFYEKNKSDAELAKSIACINNHMNWVPVEQGSSTFKCVSVKAE